MIGKTTAVSGSSITVDAITRGPGSGPDDSSPTTPSVTSHPAVVTTSATTTVTTTKTGSAADIVVGACATAQGTTDTTGAMTATHVALRPAVNGQCQGAAGSRPTNS